LTDRETTMEDTHVWVMNADGTGRREIGTVDNRQGAPVWSPDGAALLFTVQERGNVRLYRAPVACSAGLQACRPDPIVRERGSVGAFSVAKDVLAYTYASASDQAELYVRGGGGAARRMTDLNSSLLGDRKLGEVESFTFVSNDNKFEVEAFLTKPIGL